MIATTSELKHIAVIDDDPFARKAYKTLIDDMELDPVFEDGPLDSIGDYVESLSGRIDCVFSDYHLKKKSYADFNGDELAAKLYQRNVPVVICTSYTDWDVTLMRKHRRFIPVVLQGDAEPESVMSAFSMCLDEFGGKFCDTRKPWRQLVRIDELSEDGGYIYVVVPSWDSQKKVRIQNDSFPPNVLKKIQSGNSNRLYAMVNVGAEKESDLFFTEWEDR